MTRWIGVLVAGAGLTLAGQSAPATQSGAAPGRTSVLAGQVVEAGTTTPIAGATVTLGGTPSASSSPVVFSFVQAAVRGFPGGRRSVLTNAQGHFAFFDVPDGLYSIQATKAGYIPGGYGKRRANGAPQAIPVGGSPGIVDLSIPLMKYAAIGGTVLDEAGEPVIGARLRAMRRTYENGRLQYHVAASGMQADTDDRGMFRFNTLIPGDYLICIPATQTTTPTSAVEVLTAPPRSTAIGPTAPGLGLDRPSTGSGIPMGDRLFFPSIFGGRAITPPPAADGRISVYPMVFYPSTMTPSNASAIHVEAGEERTGVNIELRPVAATTVSGTLVGPSGPMPGTELALALPATQLVSDNFLEVATTTTDTGGRFVFAGVPAGQYVLRSVVLPPRQPRPAPPPSAMVQTPTGAASIPSSSGRLTPQIPTGPTLWTAMPIAVPDAGVSGLEVTMRIGHRVTGRIEFAGKSARPPDVTQRIAVMFERVDPPPIDTTGLLRATIEESGAFGTYELPAGRYVVDVRWNFAGWSLDGVMRGAIDLADVPFDLDSDVTDVVIRFVDLPGIMRGIVRTEKGTVDPTAQVLLFPAAAASAERFDSKRRLQAVRVRPDGSYVMAGMPAGDYLAVAVPDETAGDFPSPAMLKSLLAYATPVRIVVPGATALDLVTRAR